MKVNYDELAIYTFVSLMLLHISEVAVYIPVCPAW